MQQSPKQKHIHKLKRHKYKTGNAIFFCATEDCTFKVAPALALGKRTLCHRCGNEFTMDEYAVRLANPHCKDCHKGKKIDELQEAEPKLKGFATIVNDDAITMFIPNSAISLEQQLSELTGEVLNGEEEI